MKNTKNLFLLLLGLGVSSSSFGALNLKQVQVGNSPGSSEVTLLFDGKVDKNKVKLEFFNDIVQLSLSDVSVYPAKIFSVNSNLLAKVFAYQYAPNLVRCRLTIKGKAENFKDRIRLSPSGKVLTLKLDGGASVDQIGTQASQAQRVAPVNANAAPAKVAANGDDADEKALLDKVLKAGAPSNVLAPTAVKAQDKGPDKVDKVQDTPPQPSGVQQPLATGKPLPSPLKAMGKLALVVGIFMVAALGFKRVIVNRKGKVEKKAGVLGSLKGALGVFAGKTVSSEAMIEVLATHYLGPKKSIMVVKVAGQNLVLGVTDQQINLISRLGEGDSSSESLDSNEESKQNIGVSGYGSGAMAGGPAVFSEMLSSERVKPQVSSHNARSQIRSRLEGFKPL
ncbi:flagellar biosynthetic protein FliO [Bdellovibrionota bacterium FG-2]